MPRTYSMERRSEENELRRRRLISAAQSVAAEDGLPGLTLQAVAKRADVALRTVYNHFESRDDLISAAMADLAEQVRDNLSGLDFAGADGRTQMRRFVDAYTGAYLDQGEGLTALMKALDFPGIAVVVKEVRGWRRRRVPRHGRPGRARGGHADDPGSRSRRRRLPGDGVQHAELTHRRRRPQAGGGAGAARDDGRPDALRSAVTPSNVRGTIDVITSIVPAGSAARRLRRAPALGSGGRVARGGERAG